MSGDIEQVEDTLNQIHLEEDDDQEKTISLFERNESERLCQRAREIMLEISRSTKDPMKVYPQIRELYDMYYIHYHHRRRIGDALSAVGFGSIANAIINVLREKGFASWKNRTLWKTTYDMMENVWNYCNDSALLANDCARNRILETMVENLKYFPDENPKPKSEAHFIIRSTLSIMNNIARRPENKHFFAKCDCFTKLIRYKESSDNFIKVVALITLAHIADYRQTHILTKDAHTIQTIVQWLNIAIDQDPKRPMREGFTASELALAVEKLTIDGNKEMILDSKALEAFERMLDGTILNDQISATKCIWSLGMDDIARKRILKSKNIMASLERMKKVERNKTLLNCVGSALWTLNEGTRKTPQHTDQSGEQHVFISYHNRDKETVRKIWARLRQENYEVWIDMEKMAGELLEAMSDAVENSSVVILCISENYKQDNNCRSTAKYTYSREKQFIPLKMQNPYKNDGWLGMMTGTKTIYDFSDADDFDETMNKFLYDLEKQTGKDRKKPETQPDESKPSFDKPQMCTQKLEIREPSAPIQASPSPVSKESQPLPSADPSPCGAKEKIRNMTRQDVFEWLAENDLERCQENFKSVNGKMLWQLIDLKSNKETKSHYMDLLKTDYECDGSEILKISAALDDIVENS